MANVVNRANIGSCTSIEFDQKNWHGMQPISIDFDKTHLDAKYRCTSIHHTCISK